MTKHLHFKKGKLPGCAWIAFGAIGLLGLLTLIGGSWLGVFFLLPMGIIFAVREGVMIDVENKKYKSYLSVFGISPATWKPIPEGTVIGVRILKLTANRVAPGPGGGIVVDSRSSTTTFELYLYTPQPSRVVLTTSDNVEKLYFEAQNLSRYLGCEVIVDQRIPEGMYNKGL